MTNIGKTKFQILHILDILIQYSDEDNILPVDEIIKYLNQRGIYTERKSVSRDLKYIEEFLDNYDSGDNYLSNSLTLHHKVRKGYFIKRKISTGEIRVLIDGILSNKTVSKRDTSNIVKNLQGLVSKSKAKELERQVYIDNRVKSTNTSAMEIIQVIHNAIADNKKISFQYMKYGLDKNTYLRKDGFTYVVSPYALIWNNDFYYLVGNYRAYSNLSHYRIDRITNIKILDEERVRDFRDITEFNNYFDVAKYMNKIFSMYPGEETEVEIIFPNGYIDLVLETFGLEVTIIKVNEDCFKIRTRVALGEGFITWCIQFADDIEVISPPEARNLIKEQIEKMYKLYK